MRMPITIPRLSHSRIVVVLTWNSSAICLRVSISGFFSFMPPFCPHKCPNPKQALEIAPKTILVCNPTAIALFGKVGLPQLVDSQRANSEDFHKSSKLV